MPSGRAARLSNIWFQLDCMTVPSRLPETSTSASPSPPSWTLIFSDCAAPLFVSRSLCFPQLARARLDFCPCGFKSSSVIYTVIDSLFSPLWVNEHSQTLDKRPSVCLKTQRDKLQPRPGGSEQFRLWQLLVAVLEKYTVHISGRAQMY